MTLARGEKRTRYYARGAAAHTVDGVAEEMNRRSGKRTEQRTLPPTMWTAASSNFVAVQHAQLYGVNANGDEERRRGRENTDRRRSTGDGEVYLSPVGKCS
jgi:hypothetical protein